MIIPHRTQMSAGSNAVCIVTAGTIQSSPRVVREAAMLSGNGFDVKVACRTEHGVSQILSAEDVQLEFAGKSTAPCEVGKPKLAARVRYAFERYGYGALSDFILPPLSAVIVGGAELQQRLNSVEADIYVGHGVAGLVAAATTARRRGRPWAFDAEDFHTGEMRDDQWPIGRKPIFRSIERRLIPGCAYVTAASPGISRAYCDAYRIDPPAVVLNLPLATPEHVEPRRPLLVGPSIFWISQTIGPNRGLECAVRAIGAAKTRPHLYLQGHITSRFQAELTDIAASANCGDRLHVLLSCSPQAADLAPLGYDIGFCGEPGFCFNNEIALSNKLFAFLQCGLALVASDTRAHRGLAAEIGEAIKIYRREDAADLARVFDELLEKPERLARAKAASQASMTAQFVRDNQAQVLLTRISQGLSPLDYASPTHV